MEEFLSDYVERRKVLKPQLNGDDLIKMGIKKGSLIRKVLFELELLRITLRIKTVEEEREFVRRNFIKGEGSL